MKAIVPLLIALFFVVVVLYLTTGRGPLYKWRERRAFNKQKAAYLATHPQHSGSEPIVWTCECGHTDNNHTYDGCQVAEPGKYGECACYLSPREVRDRF